MLSKSIVDSQSSLLIVLLFILGASLLNLMECYSLKLFGHLSKTPIWPRFGPVFGPILVPFWSLFGTWYLQMTSWQSRLPFEGSESDGIFSTGGRIKSPQCTASPHPPSLHFIIIIIVVVINLMVIIISIIILRLSGRPGSSPS